MLGADGHVKVMDFGIAKRLSTPVGRRRRDRRGDDRESARRADRHARLHVAGTAARRARRSTLGHLRVWSPAARVADRQASVHARRRSSRRRTPSSTKRRRRSITRLGRVAAPRARGRPLPREGSRSPLPVAERRSDRAGTRWASAFVALPFRPRRKPLTLDSVALRLAGPIGAAASSLVRPLPVPRARTGAGVQRARLDRRRRLQQHDRRRRLRSIASGSRSRSRSRSRSTSTCIRRIAWPPRSGGCSGRPRGPSRRDARRRSGRTRSVRAVLACDIAQLGTHYSLTARVTRSADARSRAHRLRHGLEQRRHARGARIALATRVRTRPWRIAVARCRLRAAPLPIVTTSSLDALKMYADSLKSGGDSNASLELARQAVVLDPQFALAHAETRPPVLSRAGAGHARARRETLQIALGLADRLTVRERLWIQASVEDSRGNRQQAVNAFNVYLAQYPDDVRRCFGSRGRRWRACNSTLRPSRTSNASWR